MPAGTVLLVMIGALACAALLNAGPMLRRAETSELGPGRDIRIGFWEPLEAFSSAVGLDVPRQLLDKLTNSETPAAGQQGTEIVAGGPSRGQLGHAPLDVPPAGPRTSVLDEAPDASSRDDQPVGPLLLPPDGGAAAGEDSSPSGTPLGLPSVVSPNGGERALPDPPADDATAGVSDPGDGDDEVQDDDTAAPAASQGPDAATGSTTSPFALRRPTVEDPLRVLIVGDSTMDAVGTAMLRELSTTGITDARLDFRVSTGLSRPDFFDWPTHIREIRGAEGTEVVVIMIGANDAQPILVDGDVEQHGSDRWYAAYRQRVATLLDETTADGGWVIWIGQPVMRNDPYNARLTGLNALYAEEIARYPNAVYIDPRPTTSAQDGTYTAYLPDADGNQELIRQTDGVHLTPDGGERIAPLVIEEINRVAPLY
ncbi:MAG: DUF459 domain-containing protein [Acidimicrobiales bacterium]